MNLANLVDNILVVEGDEAESPVPGGDLVVSQHGFLDLAELLKVGLDVFQTGIGTETANEDLPGPHDQLRVGLPGNSNLGFHELAIELERKMRMSGKFKTALAYNMI